MSDLSVELYGERIGTLSGTRDRFDFTADHSAMDRWGIASPILSFAVPLLTSPPPREVSRRRNFFEELLPESAARALLAGRERIDTDNTMALLRRFGLDTAGAVQVLDDDDRRSQHPSAEPASGARIRDLLQSAPVTPLGNVSRRRLSSLAGVQPKILLALVDGEWAESLDGLPSTHILKPVVSRMPTLIFDEEYGARIARRLGLASFDTRIETFDGVTALVIERYDRDAGAPGGRLHQEDFNQALGLRGDEKYDENVGDDRRTLARIATTLRDHVGSGAVADLLRMTTLSAAIGNLDMHTKNISVLHLPDGTARLAPMYDVVPQTHQEVDLDLALRVGGVIDHESLRVDDLIAEGQSWGVRDAEVIVESTINAVLDAVASEVPLPGAHFGLRADIERIAARLRSPVTGHIDPRGPRPLGDAAGGWGGPAAR